MLHFDLLRPVLGRSGLLKPRLMWKHGLGRERKQHVAGYASEARVTRIHKQQPIDDHGARPIHRATFGLYAVHRLKFAPRIKIPKNRTVFGVVAANMTIERSGKHDAGDTRHRRRLSRAASYRRSVRANDRRSIPDLR